MEFSKHYKWNKDKPPEGQPRESPVQPGKLPVDIKKDAPGPKETMGFAEVMNPGALKEGDIFAGYMEMVEFTEEILEKIKNGQPINGVEIAERTRRLMEEVMLGGKFFIGFFFEDTEEESKARHLVNTTILALLVGIELGYNKSRLMEIAVGALLHDIGLIKLIPLTKLAKKLTRSEYEEIKKHPLYGLEALKRLGEFSEEVTRIAHEHHERLDGSGYPRGLKNGHIHEDALLVGIIDMFEAMTHTRPYRKKMSAYDALKEIINTGAHCLEPRYVEALVRCIGLYSLGSWVELSTGEIGKVIETNKTSPLRPTVTVIYNSHGQKLTEGKIIDLSRQPVIYIRRVLSDEELAAKIST